MSTLNIKNLSFAMEALSRIPDVKEQFDRVKDLLRDEIIQEEERNSKYYQAKSAMIPPKPPAVMDGDDDIPF